METTTVARDDAPVTVEATEQTAPRSPWRAVTAADLAMALPLGHWATWLTWGTGGREAHRLSVALVLCGVALLVVRPWRLLPERVSALLLSCGVCAFGVAALSPTGWDGADEAASYAYAALLAWLVLAWAKDGVRRLAVLTVVVAAAGFQFMQGSIAWMGSGTPDSVFVGTFYWHNQAGIFMAIGAGIGLAASLGRTPVLRAVAWIIVPLCGAGVLFSTSRASQMCLALAFVLCTAIAVSGRCGRRLPAAARVMAMGLLTAAAARLLSGPPFFETRGGTGGLAVGDGVRQESLSGNVGHRLDFWGQAVDVFTHWPWTGSGFHGFGGAAASRDPDAAVGSAFVHNGYLQVLAEGGLLLGLPVIGALAVLVVWTARGLPAAVRGGDVVRLAAVVGLVLLLLHTGIDFDWGYPTLLSLTGLLGAICGPGLSSPARVHGWPRELPWAAVAASLVVLGAVTAWGGGLDLNLPLSGVST